jgi:hypothetical protein
VNLELLEERRFANGVLILRHGVRGAARVLASAAEGLFGTIHNNIR